ncbi:hypothetical protein ACFPRL_15170 [Pseudoclavibacter helvolus]
MPRPACSPSCPATSGSSAPWRRMRRRRRDHGRRWGLPVRTWGPSPHQLPRRWPRNQDSSLVSRPGAAGSPSARHSSCSASRSFTCSPALHSVRSAPGSC